MKTFNSLLALAAFLAAPAVAFQTFNNCSGTETSLPANSASDTLPQVQGSQTGGWEQWEFAISEANDTVIFFRWYAGDEANVDSDPTQATFTVDALFSNGTEFTVSLNGSLTSTSAAGQYSIAIGSNTLVWDDSLGSYNVSISLDGFVAELTTQLIPPSPFTPALDGVKSQLSQGLFFNIPVPVGFINGQISWPSADEWTIDSVASLRHSYANSPLYEVVKGYARISSWDGALSVNWVQANDTTGTLVNATQVSTSSPVSLIYEFTQEPDLLQIFTIPTDPKDPTAPASTELEFTGCAATNDVPLQWITATSSLLNILTDAAGGTKTYYTISINATSPFPGSLTTPLAPVGLLEIYRSNQHATTSTTASAKFRARKN